MVGRNALLGLLAAASAAREASAVKPFSTTNAAEASNIVAGAYIFEFEDGADTSDFHAVAGAESTTRMTLDFKLFKGTSIQFNDLDTAEEKAAALLALPAIRAAYPVKTFAAPKPEVVWTGKAGKDYSDVQKRQEGDVFSTHVMTQVDKLRAEGFTGTGIKVAVIDSGIDYLHPALGGCFGAGCLVSYGYDLVGDHYTGYNPAVPDPDPIDCAGHGSHVAGIVAAQSNPFGFTGAAPGVTLGAFKVFGCPAESAANDVLIAAYNMAFEAGSDIITASIGGPSGWSEDPWAVAVQRIVEAGVPCLVAAGNDGATGMFYAATAANGKKITAIASFDNVITPSLGIESQYTVDGTENGTFIFTYGDPDAWGGVVLPLWALSFDTTDPANGCNPFPADTPDLSNKIVLIRRGTCAFAQKLANAAEFGARYVLFYNNIAGSSTVPFTAPGILAVGMVAPAVGAKFIDILKAGSELVLAMGDPETLPLILTVEDNNLTGGFVSSYSTWGPTNELDSKPQVGTPGKNILSTYPRQFGSYAVLSGTSMATPLAAGIVALIAQVRGTFDPALIENLLSATANPQMFNDGFQTYDALAPVPQQGGGFVRAYEAAYATTLLNASSISFNDTDYFIPTQSFTIKNLGSQAVTYELGNSAAALAYTLYEGEIYAMRFPNELTYDQATLAFSESSVTVAAGQDVTIAVTATPPSGVDASRLPVWSGYITLNGTDGSSFSLPYIGVTGSMHGATVLEAALVSISGDLSYTAVPDNTTFVLPAPGAPIPEDTLPAIAISLVMGSALIRVDVVPMTTCPPNTTTEFWGVKTIGQPRYFPLTYNSRGIAAVDWDGRLNDGTYAPPGKYKFAVKALHIFGDGNNLEEYDVTETQAIKITYE